MQHQQQPQAAYHAPGHQGPITSQAGVQLQFAPDPAHAVQRGLPPGLQYLGMIDQLLVKQKIEMAEALSSWESRNKYVVMNSMGQQLFKAVERSDTCERQFCGANRSFEMYLVDNSGNEVMRIYREGGMCANYGSDASVEAPPGTVVGYLNCQSFLGSVTTVKDAGGNPVFKIIGPALAIGEVDFPIKTADERQQIGRLQKQWSGFFKEAFTDADNFQLSFPMDLAVPMKAALIGAVFMIDFMIFEKENN